MTAENFQIIRDICRVGLFYSGGAEQVRRHVARLRNRLNRHAKELVAQGEGAGAEAEKAKATATRLEADAAALTEMLERTLRPAPADGRDPPTPETLAKLEEDVIGALAQRGRLAPHEVDAALEIRGVFAALKEGLVARAGKGDRQRARGRRKVQRQPLERMRDDVARIYGERYRPWAREMARRQVIESNLRGPDKRLLDAVVDIVVDNRAPIWVGIEVGATAEAVESALKFALSRYAVLAGFAPAWRREGLTRSRRFD